MSIRGLLRLGRAATTRGASAILRGGQALGEVPQWCFPWLAVLVCLPAFWGQPGSIDNFVQPVRLMKDGPSLGLTRRNIGNLIDIQDYSGLIISGMANGLRLTLRRDNTGLLWACCSGWRWKSAVVYCSRPKAAAARLPCADHGGFFHRSTVCACPDQPLWALLLAGHGESVHPFRTASGEGGLEGHRDPAASRGPDLGDCPSSAGSCG